MPGPSGFLMAPPCGRGVMGCFDAPNIQNRPWRGGGPFGTQGKGAGADARTMRNKGGGSRRQNHAEQGGVAADARTMRNKGGVAADSRTMRNKGGGGQCVQNLFII